MQYNMEQPPYFPTNEYKQNSLQPQTVVVNENSSKGPYLLCAFICASLFLAVGTFVTSHAFNEDNKDSILVIIGPSILIVGGLVMSGTLTVCIIACQKNRDTQDFEYDLSCDKVLSVGTSTFYDDRGILNPYDGESTLKGYTNPFRVSSRNSNEDALRFLAQTVVQEHHRKLSQNQIMYDPETRSQVTYDQETRSPMRRHNHENLNHSIDENINEITTGFGLGSPQLEYDDKNGTSLEHLHQFSDNNSLSVTPKLKRNRHRDRHNITDTDDSESYTSKRSFRYRNHRLKRSHTSTPKRRRNLVDQHHTAIQHYPDSPLTRGFTTVSRRKKKPKSQNNQPDICPLPSYDSNILNCLMEKNGSNEFRPTFNRTISQPSYSHELENDDLAYENPISPQSPRPHHRIEVHKTSGHISGPSPAMKRRPSIAMGVRGLTNRSNDLLNELNVKNPSNSADEQQENNYTEGNASESGCSTNPGSRKAKNITRIDIECDPGEQSEPPPPTVSAAVEYISNAFYSIQ